MRSVKSNPEQEKPFVHSFWTPAVSKQKYRPSIRYVNHVRGLLLHRSNTIISSLNRRPLTQCALHSKHTLVRSCDSALQPSCPMILCVRPIVPSFPCTLNCSDSAWMGISTVPFTPEVLHKLCLSFCGCNGRKHLLLHLTALLFNTDFFTICLSNPVCSLHGRNPREDISAQCLHAKRKIQDLSIQAQTNKTYSFRHIQKKQDLLVQASSGTYEQDFLVQTIQTNKKNQFRPIQKRLTRSGFNKKKTYRIRLNQTRLTSSGTHAKTCTPHTYMSTHTHMSTETNESTHEVMRKNYIESISK